jgi:hypothetical protein
MIRKLLIASSYLLGALIVVGGTVLLIAYGNGYSYDFAKGRLVHRGLILLESIPSGAKVTLGDKQLTQKTPYRQTFEGGNYEFTLTKDGYRTWNKRIDVVPAQVSLAQYVILIPQHLQVDSIANQPTISQFTASRDRHRVAYTVPSGADAGIWSLDTGNRAVTKLYSTPSAAGVLTEVDEIQGWSDDASHVLVKATSGDRVQFLLLSSNPSDQVINITDSLKTDIANLTFSKSTWRELYWQSPEGLRRVDMNSNTISDILVPKAAAFTFAGDRVLYIDTSQPTASLWSIDHSNHKQQLVAALPPSTRYALGYTTYINTPQAMVVAVDTGTATLYSDVYSSNVSSKTITAAASQVSFNGDGRFALLSDEHHVATYDLEQGRTYNFPAINSTVTGLSWFDNYHIQFNRGGQIVLSEYDSNYAVAITRGNALPPYNSQDNKYMFAVGDTSTGASQIKGVKIRQ